MRLHRQQGLALSGPRCAINEREGHQMSRLNEESPHPYVIGYMGDCADCGQPPRFVAHTSRFDSATDGPFLVAVEERLWATERPEMAKQLRDLRLRLGTT